MSSDVAGSASGIALADDSIHPYRIDVPQDVLDDLQRRLESTRWAFTDDPSSWADGAASSYLRALVAHWITDYDWRAQERRLNSYPQYTTVIGGEPIHFVWLQGEASANRRPPVVLTHGWPGSFLEFLTVGDQLVAHGHDVVIPTIPGFGFPGPPRAGRATVQGVSLAWAALMQRLGYSSYYAHGGDIGSVIARVLGLVDTEHVLAIHLTSIMGGIPDIGGLPSDALTTKAEKAAFRYATELSAYAHLHATRPLSLSHALSDSPAGVLGWIVERFHDWTEATTTLRDTVDRDELITNTMIYWLTNATTSSATFYKTNGFYGGMSFEIPVSPTPTAVSVFPHDIIVSDRTLAEPYNRITEWTEHTTGGHFPGLEVPDLLAADLLRAFSEDA
ncbi:MAG: epoxide hydrolase family protein [Actinomycetes bacterium]